MKEMNRRIRLTGKDFIILFIILLTFVYSYHPAHWMVWFWILGQFAFLLLYSPEKNKGFFEQILKLELIFFIGYSLAYWFRFDLSVKDLILTMGCFVRRKPISCIILALINLVEFIIVRLPMQSIQEDSPGKRLFQEREADLKQLSDMAEQFPVVGINSAWGSGKTFLTKEFIRLNREKYEFIEFSFLSCNIGDTRGALVKRIEEILHKYRIYSGSFYDLDLPEAGGKLIPQAGGLVIAAMQSVVNPEHKEMVAVLERLKQRADLLPKKIIVIYDDLDRIKDTESIKMILDFSERLSGKGIRFVMQYDGERLKQQGLERDFLEKYVPYEMVLTGIPLRTQISAFGKEAGLSEEDINRCKRLMNESGSNYYLEKKLGISLQRSLDMSNRNVTPRTIRSFLFELNSELGWCRNNQETLAVVFHTVLIKHLFYENYKELEYGRRMPESFMFHIQEGENKKDISILQLAEDLENGIRTTKEIKEILDNNPQALFCIAHYNYGWKAVFNPENTEDKGSEWNQHDRSMVSEDILLEQEKNDRIDHIIWFMIARGTSEYTDPQVAVQNVKEILKEDYQKQKNAWEIYCRDTYHGTNAHKNSDTIFRIGVKPSVSLFQAFYVTDQEKEIWLKLLEFYSEVLCPSTLNIEVIDTMTYVDLYKGKDVLIKSAVMFSELGIEGNLNQSKSYWRFLSKYISAIGAFGYCEGCFGMEKSTGVLMNVQNNIGIAEKYLVCCIDELKKVEEQYSPEMLFARELKILQKFIEHNIKLIKTKPAIHYQLPINVRVREVAVHQNKQVFNDLMEKKQAGEEGLEKAVDQAYREGKLSVRDLRRVMEKKAV